MVKVVGVGAAPNLLTEEAKEILKNASVVYGSERAINLAKEHIRGKIVVLKSFKDVNIASTDVILSTGDPMVSGLSYLGDEIIPGISSIQLVCARLKIDLCDSCVIDGHAKDEKYIKEELEKALSIDRIAILIGHRRMDLEKILSGAKRLKVVICEDMGYPGEEIKYGYTDDIPEISSDMVIVVVNPKAGVTEPGQR
jgi:precorrin-6y C5,15-methyltransferase (decarboxylating), CbiE subunit